MSEIDDRRQRALEAGWDTDDRQDGMWTAIETATQVKITDDIVQAAVTELPCRTEDDLKDLIEAAFHAAGFEVVE